MTWVFATPRHITTVKVIRVCIYLLSSLPQKFHLSAMPCMYDLCKSMRNNTAHVHVPMSSSFEPSGISPSNALQGFGLHLDALDVCQVVKIFQKLLFNIPRHQVAGKAAQHMYFA